jgi:glycosyltransferase involved in cell wall biosynthesis
MTIGLVIPSWRRPFALGECLASVASQTQPFDEIVVAVHSSDDESRAFMEKVWPAVRVAVTSDQGVIAAMLAGARSLTTEFVTFTDDDAILPPHFVTRLRERISMASPEVVGFGGRDIIYDAQAPRPTTLTNRVGVITRYGRIIGNHHRGDGAPRTVLMLKGVNSTYRRAVVAFPRGLSGDGAQAHFEVAIGVHLASQNYLLEFDPQHHLEHHVADRMGPDQRQRPLPIAIRDSAFNAMRSLPRPRQNARLAYLLVCGDSACPGVARNIMAAVQLQGDIIRRTIPSLRGSISAWRLRKIPLEFENVLESN